MFILLAIDYTAITLKILNILGIFLGVLGLIYASYGAIKERVSVTFLSRFLQISTPIVITTTLFGLIGNVLGSLVYHTPRVTFAESVLFGTTGGLIGAYNGIFLDPFQQRRQIFSFAHFLGGALLTFGVVFVGNAILDVTLATTPQLTPSADITIALKDAAILTPFGALVGGFWRFINNPRLYRQRGVAPAATKLTLTSWEGAILGFLTAFPLGLAITVVGNLNFVQFANNPALGEQLRLIILNSLGASALFGAIGAVNGSIARQFFQWANTLDDKRISAVGFVITLVGFLFQLGAPLQDLVTSFMQ